MTTRRVVTTEARLRAAVSRELHELLRWTDAEGVTDLLVHAVVKAVLEDTQGDRGHQDWHHTPDSVGTNPIFTGSLDGFWGR